MSKYADDRYYNYSREGVSAEAVEAEVDRLLKFRLAAVYDWASNPDYYEENKGWFYGDAQMHVLSLLTQHEVDAVEWVEGKYRRESDPA